MPLAVVQYYRQCTGETETQTKYENIYSTIQVTADMKGAWGVGLRQVRYGVPHLSGENSQVGLNMNVKKYTDER